MTYINPLAGAPLAAAQAQQHAATDKSRQIRRQQVVARNAAAAGADQPEPQVENAERIAAVHEDGRREPPKRGTKARRKPADDQNADGAGAHIDVRA